MNRLPFSPRVVRFMRFTRVAVRVANTASRESVGEREGKTCSIPNPSLWVWLLAIAFNCTTLQIAFPQDTAIQTSQVVRAIDTDEKASAVNEVLTFTAPKQYEMLIGLKVTAANQNMVSITASTVFPESWPEQKVEVLESKVPAPFQFGFRDLPGGNKQLLFQSPYLQAGTTAEATVRVQIEKSHIIGPTDTSVFVAPKRISRELKNFMGNSPYIDASSSEIRKIVREIDLTEPATAWQRVELLYDWVRENIAYENGELKSVRQALKDKSGDCEEMTSTFVALCRSADIPARCVWIPNHCYPEFYLEDETGAGHWFPCQVAGTRAFGSMPEYLPILQKGDRFKVPEDKELLRYLNDKLKSQELYKPGRPTPKVEFIRQ